VREAFRTLFRKHARAVDGTDEKAAEQWLDGLIADGRYIEDVYAAG
jgi:cytochrome P450/NADPH-cytochrome P450 reductase